MKIYLATGNLNKKREVQELFPEHTVVIPKDEGIAFDPEETGTTFYENSLIKAKALWDMVHCPVLADDSITKREGGKGEEHAPHPSVPRGDAGGIAHGG